jgi:hypothetical protein
MPRDAYDLRGGHRPTVRQLLQVHQDFTAAHALRGDSLETDMRFQRVRFR